MKLLILNQSDLDRRIRAVVAVLLLTFYLTTSDQGSSLAMGSLFVSLVLIFNSLSGNCYIYRGLGINTCPLPESE
jgi:hypothetical protein